MLEFVSWPRPDAVLIRWTAEYDDWNLGSALIIPFCFEGEAVFAGIEMQVKKESDATPILSHVLPNLDQSAFIMNLGREIKLGPMVQDDRRRWPSLLATESVRLHNPTRQRLPRRREKLPDAEG